MYATLQDLSGPVAPKQVGHVTVTFFTASAVATSVVDNPFVLSTVHPFQPDELVTALLFCEAVAVTGPRDFEMFIDESRCYRPRLTRVTVPVV